MKTQTKYLVNKIKTLIDLNGDVINFHLNFHVSSVNNSPFEMLITDQRTMNMEESLQYQSINEGEISGEMSWDRNSHQSFYMILRSNEPTEIIVELELTPIEPSKTEYGGQVVEKKDVKQQTETKYSFYLIVLVVCIIIGAMIYFNQNGDTGLSSVSKIYSGPKKSILSNLKQANSSDVVNKLSSFLTTNSI
jgi:uncharacterized membrane protein